MSTRHTRRAKTPAAGGLQSKRRWLTILSVPIVAIVPVAGFVLYPIHKDDIAAIIRAAGFDPVIPPNRLRGPGALYVVDGDSYEIACDVDPTLVDAVVRRSPTETRFRTRLENGTFSLAGNFAASLEGKLGGVGLRSIELRLTDVGISEIAHNNLWQIENSLLREPSCDDVVHRLLKAHKKICQGYSALSATTIYKVRTNAKLDVEAKAVVSAVQKEISDNSKGEISLRSENELAGENLFYGIRLSPLCITLDDATEPSILPEQPAAAADVAGKPAAG